MIQRDKSFYDLLGVNGLGFDNAKFQVFVDKFKEKYNTLDTDGFDWDNEIQIDFTYQQLQAELGIATLPTFVDIDSPAPYKSQESLLIGTNKIPRFKHGFAMNEKIIREQMILAQRFGGLAEGARTTLMSLLFDSLDKLIKGNRNELTYQRMRVVSTGQFAITAENNPQGIKGITFDFGIPSKNKTELSGTAQWWTKADHTVANQGSKSDPLKDLKDLRKAATKAGVPLGKFELSKDLWDDMQTHTAVLQRVGYALYPAASTGEVAVQYAQNLTEDAVKATVEKIIGAPVVVRDTLAVVEGYDAETRGLKKKTINSFEPTNVSYVPTGMLGTIKAVEPIAVPDPAARLAWFDGGRTVIKNTFDTDTNTQYISSECTALVVPSVSRYMYICKVTA